jgi:peptidoglycan/LPS O-acetylase OafA/YrhL
MGLRSRLGYVPALDGLRGAAILLVVAGHAFGVPIGAGLGVDLFFVLSGFLITTLLLEELDEYGRISLRGFYVRRARRLFPALAALLVAFLMLDAVKGQNGLGQVAAYGLYAGNVYEAFISAVSSPDLGLVHLWSLAQEEQFYLVWPLCLLVLVRSRRPARWLVIVLTALIAYRVALVAHGAGLRRIDRGPDTQSLPLVAGCLAAFVRARHPSWRLPPAAVVLAMAAFVLGALALPTWYLRPLYELAAAALVYAAVTDGEFARLVSPRWLIWVGGISYSLYLWHYVVLWVFGFKHVVPALIISFVAAWVSYRFVEQRFRRRRSPGVTGRPAPASSPA